MRNFARFFANRILLWSGAFFASCLVSYLFCHGLLDRDPAPFAIYTLAACCAAFLTVDTLFFLGELNAKPGILQIGNRLYITKADHLVVTVVLNDSKPLTEEELMQVLEDVFRFNHDKNKRTKE